MGEVGPGFLLIIFIVLIIILCVFLLLIIIILLLIFFFFLIFSGNDNFFFFNFNFLLLMFLALLLASALELAPQARSDKSRRVGLPSLYSGPGMLPMRARKLARRGLSPFFTGALRFMPCALADALPLALRPPDADLPSLRCQAGDLAILLALQQIRVSFTRAALATDKGLHAAHSPLLS